MIVQPIFITLLLFYFLNYILKPPYINYNLLFQINTYFIL
jgi:hypothetical protein